MIEMTEKHRDNFFNKVVKTDNGCWLWSGKKDSLGYGKIRINKKLYSAHRVSFEIFKSEIPKGLVIDHLCRNPSCVNPTHLEMVTNKENILRGIGPTAINSKKSSCSKGHPFNENNTYFSLVNGVIRRRYCRICHNELVKRRYKELKQVSVS